MGVKRIQKIFRELSRTSKVDLTYNERQLLVRKGYITIKYKKVPYIDNPKKFAKMPVGYLLTEKGKFYAKGWNSKGVNTLIKKRKTSLKKRGLY